MLLIDKKQVSPDDVQKALGVKFDMAKLMKKPLFEINPALVVADPANGLGATKVRQGMEFPAYFRVKLRDGRNVEIRYCTNRTPDLKTHGQTEVYTPKKVYFEGKAEFLSDDQDKAIYYFLHFYNKNSPFREKGLPFEGKPFEYEFQDDVAKADAAIAKIVLRTKATQHAMSLQGEELIIIAKGMRIEGAHELEPSAVRARLMEYADAKPQEYLDKANSQVNHIEGLIYDAIDKNIFVIDSGSGVKRWKWAMGSKEGEVIAEFSNNVPDLRRALITHIQQTPGAITEFLPVLIDTTRLVKAKTNIAKELVDVDVLNMLKDADIEHGTVDEPEELDETLTGGAVTTLPTNFKEAQNLLGQQGCGRSPALAKELMDGITANEITLDNIDDFIYGNKKA